VFDFKKWKQFRQDEETPCVRVFASVLAKACAIPRVTIQTALAG
jgi:hypothetical protein